ncbi:hypothetical protein [Hydrogenophaga sp. OTU3427]|uniref:hypothetical protein n=1 Tax=Hydrogenophaga sp. OTU3427 TaxID=3043856 RepID=UPI00313A8F7C
MNETESDHNHPSLENGILFNYYRATAAQSNQLSNLIHAEALSWQLYAQQAPGHAVPLVMLHASRKTWELGSATIKKDVMSLVKAHAPQFGWPSVWSTCPDRAERCGPQSAWAIRIRDHYCKFIMIANDKKILTPSSIIFLPVFSLQRHIQSQTLDALNLIFPKVAAAAVQTMDKNTVPN